MRGLFSHADVFSNVISQGLVLQSADWAECVCVL